MSKKYKKALFLFRRDLRVADNVGLIEAFKSAEEVIPAFIFDEMQIGKGNVYRGENSLRFMFESLEDLNKQIGEFGGEMVFGEGGYLTELKRFVVEGEVEAVFLNRDYTPFSIERDLAIEGLCKKLSVDFVSHTDLILVNPERVKNDFKVYTMYTAFFRRAVTYPVAKPVYFKGKFAKGRVDDADVKVLLKLKESLFGVNAEAKCRGGRGEGLKTLKRVESIKDYEVVRDVPALDGTTHLSAHLKFGTVSVREVYHLLVRKFGVGSQLVKELFWREFFTHIVYWYPRVLTGCFNRKFDQIKWDNDEVKFKAWCEGRTGVPIVDAGMRELNATGYMHNRVRMIVASFLIKDLHVYWRWGERYFAQKLIDYDAAVNNGNWQWVAGTGCDSAPYFRIFNPWVQAKRFDPDAKYIKKWVSELGGLSAKEIHGLWKDGQVVLGVYPQPIVRHADAVGVTKEMYGRV